MKKAANNRVRWRSFVSALCSTCALPVLYLCSTCALPVLYLCSTCALPVLYLCSTCALPVLYLCSTCALPVLYLCSTCALPVLYLCSTCALPVLYLERREIRTFYWRFQNRICKMKKMTESTSALSNFLNQYFSIVKFLQHVNCRTNGTANILLA